MGLMRPITFVAPSLLTSGISCLEPLCIFDDTFLGGQGCGCVMVSSLVYSPRQYLDDLNSVFQTMSHSFDVYPTR